MSEQGYESDAQVRAHWLWHIDDELSELAANKQEGGHWNRKMYLRWMWLRDLVSAQVTG